MLCIAGLRCSVQKITGAGGRPSRDLQVQKCLQMLLAWMLNNAHSTLVFRSRTNVIIPPWLSKSTVVIAALGLLLKKLLFYHLVLSTQTRVDSTVLPMPICCGSPPRNVQDPSLGRRIEVVRISGRCRLIERILHSSSSIYSDEALVRRETVR